MIQVISLLAVLSSIGTAQFKIKINPETESEIVILTSNFKSIIEGKGKKSIHTNTENNNNGEEVIGTPEEEKLGEEIPEIPEEMYN